MTIKQLSATEIIDSIVHVTGHTNREMLEASLASTLYELLDVQRVALYKVHYEHNQPHCFLTLEVIKYVLHFYEAGETPKQNNNLEINNYLKQCVSTQRAAEVVTNEGQYFYLRPISNHLGEITGVFCLDSNTKNTPSDMKFIEGYFKIFRNYLNILDVSEHDSLTGLLNRRTFDQNLEKLLAEWHKAHDYPVIENHNYPLRRQAQESKSNWLAVIDIDHFKQVNDEYGHLYGDEVLLLLSNIMRECFRGYDKLFRFGGEEFVVILRSTDQSGVDGALERFRASVESYQFPKNEEITVSIGYAESHSHSIPAQLLGQADEALYQAKNLGRNRICQFEQLKATSAA